MCATSEEVISQLVDCLSAQLARQVLVALERPAPVPGDLADDRLWHAQDRQHARRDVAEIAGPAAGRFAALAAFRKLCVANW